MERYWLIHDGTGSVEGGTGWYLMVLGQNRALQVDIRCYWVGMKRYWLIHDGTGSGEGGTGWYLMVLGQ